MRPLHELINTDESAMPLIRDWISTAEVACEVLPPSNNAGQVLAEVQVTTRSPMGAIAYETGGILVDGGWLRFLGSGHPRLSRNLAEWNRGRSDGMFLVADDAAGGFFALNGGAMGDDRGNVYYWAPDRLDWEALEVGFTDFFTWSLTRRLAEFYDGLRWPTWAQDTIELTGDLCFGFYPFLWTAEGSVKTSVRRAVPVAEAFDLKIDIVTQLRTSD